MVYYGMTTRITKLERYPISGQPILVTYEDGVIMNIQELTEDDVKDMEAMEETYRSLRTEGL